MDQEKIMHIAGVEQRARELGEQLQFIDTQIAELKNFKATTQALIETKEEEAFTSLGNRVFIESKISSKKQLLVDVGAGVLIKKTPEQTQEVVSSQIERLIQVRMQIVSQLDGFHKELEKFANDIQS